MQQCLGAAGFMAAGAFACFNIVLRIPDLPFIGALIGSGLIAAAFGVLFGLPSLRVRGLYLMVATLASQFFIVWMIPSQRSHHYAIPALPFFIVLIFINNQVRRALSVVNV